MSIMFVEKKRAALLCIPIGAALPIYCLEKLGGGGKLGCGGTNEAPSTL